MWGLKRKILAYEDDIGPALVKACRNNSAISDQFQHLADQNQFGRPNFLYIFNGTASVT